MESERESDDMKDGSEGELSEDSPVKPSGPAEAVFGRLKEALLNPAQVIPDAKGYGEYLQSVEKRRTEGEPNLQAMDQIQWGLKEIVGQVMDVVLEGKPKKERGG
eukprot:3090351-Alexandrium_andersonii.AAC.1